MLLYDVRKRLTSTNSAVTVTRRRELFRAGKRKIISKTKWTKIKVWTVTKNDDDYDDDDDDIDDGDDDDDLQVTFNNF